MSSKNMTRTPKIYSPEEILKNGFKLNNFTNPKNKSDKTSSKWLLLLIKNMMAKSTSGNSLITVSKTILTLDHDSLSIAFIIIFNFSSFVLLNLINHPNLIQINKMLKKKNLKWFLSFFSLDFDFLSEKNPVVIN